MLQNLVSSLYNFLCMLSAPYENLALCAQGFKVKNRVLRASGWEPATPKSRDLVMKEMEEREMKQGAEHARLLKWRQAEQVDRRLLEHLDTRCQVIQGNREVKIEEDSELTQDQEDAMQSMVETVATKKCWTLEERDQHGNQGKKTLGDMFDTLIFVKRSGSKFDGYRLHIHNLHTNGAANYPTTIVEASKKIMEHRDAKKKGSESGESHLIEDSLGEGFNTAHYPADVPDGKQEVRDTEESASTRCACGGSH